jgi:hopanoid biosynthesis associated radical SAM protein HpnH
MRYPLSLILDSAKHLAARKLHGHRKFALVLTLDPLGGVQNGSCSNSAPGTNGDAIEAAHASGPMLTVEQCLGALKECDAPVVRIRGGEPLEYPHIGALAREILARGKHVFLCTDGTLIRRRLHLIPPVGNFFWNVRLDGTESVHDRISGRPGLFAEAWDGIKAAKNAGFYAVVTTTICPRTDVDDVAELYERLNGLHVDGYLFSPDYGAKKVCKNSSATFHQLMRERFRELSEKLSDYNVMNSPVYLEYLRGERELDCCVWGSPEYGPQGWVVPCSVLNQGYESSYGALLENTIWENYGRGLNPSCETCMCDSGYETAAIIGTNAKVGDTWKMLAWQLRGKLGEKRERVQKP